MIMSVGNTTGRTRLIEFSCTYLTAVLHCYDVVEMAYEGDSVMLDAWPECDQLREGVLESRRVCKP